MKICWDNLEGVWLNRGGNFKKGTSTYVYKEACAKCGEPYLALKYELGKFCSNFCANSGENNPMYGKTHSIKARKKISENAPNRIGVLNPNWKGGIRTTGMAAYDTHKDNLKPYENIRKQCNTGLLEVACAYCGRWYAPRRSEVACRFNAINYLNKGEGRLYCSENCKLACPTFGKQKYPKGFKHTTSREVSTYLRQMVMERDNWTCQICGKTIKEAQLHVHHMDPVAQNLMFQNDMDSCVTLCKSCHKMVHSQRGCRYVDLQCKNEIAYTRKFKDDICLKSVNFRA